MLTSMAQICVVIVSSCKPEWQEQPSRPGAEGGRDAAQERRDLYLTQSQGFAKVAKDNDFNPKVVRTVITAYL